MSRALSIGILVADIVGKPIDSLPEKGKLEFLHELQLHTGGCAVNTGIALSRLGIKMEVIGMVGKDVLGDFIINWLKAEGIETTNITRSSKSTSSTLVMVSQDGERSFFHHIGANSELIARNIDDKAIRRAGLIHIGGTFLMPKFDGADTRKVLKRAKELGKITSLDTAWDPTGRWLKTMGPCLPFIDYFLPSIEEAREITGEKEPRKIADFLLKKGVGTVALKMGGQGCYVKDRREEIRLPGLEVKVKDTTGAGDAFTAGFLFGILKGYGLRRSVKFANVLGASCVMNMGATGGMINYEEALRGARRFYPDFDEDD